MKKTTLSQVLAAFEDKRGPLTMANIARDLAISPARLDGMVQYWVRKGKLREAGSFSSCGTCGHGASGCPYVAALPKCYELAVDDESRIPLASAGITCRHQK